MGNWLKETVDLMRLRAQGKSELSRLPKRDLVDASNSGWLGFFWSLPPEAWSKAVDFRLEWLTLKEEQDRLRNEDRSPVAPSEPYVSEREARDAEISAKWDDHIAREDAFLRRHGIIEETEEEAEPISPEELEQLRSELKRIESEIKQADEDQAPVPSGEFVHVQEMIRIESEKLCQARALIDYQWNKPRGHERYEQELSEPWLSWIASLPAEAKEDGLLACAVWQEMIELRGLLIAAIRERQALPGVFETEATRVMESRMLFLRGRMRRCELLYRDFAKPFFEHHGQPPLPNVDDLSVADLSDKQIVRQRRWLRSRYVERDEPAEEDRHWKDWLQRIRGSDRSTALRVRVLYDELAALRNRLANEVLTLRDEDLEAGQNFEALKPDLIRVDREYHALAKPLFAKYGKPAFLIEHRHERRDEENAG